MSEKEVKIEARLATVEYMLQRLYFITYAANGVTSEQIEKAHASLREQHLTQTFPSDDPAISALASGETEEALSDFLSGLEKLLKTEGRKK